ncbi:HD domain-containing protein [Paenibacillus sp. YPG26]|uniref:HD domain-containing protein n=1 Tax=Paenibacillus sp. YPG26 TaxID=2878915 RepID=UPI00203AA438|nr:HD domain-containing protein [Paenibacillus sp. YPG26]USB33207.1 HD domain-containing protein [Paenibacillus sp. YPG26]
MHQITIPDSGLAKRAAQLVFEISPEFLYNHCMRTYAFGDALGKRYGLKYDPELFFLGAVLHDVGLTEHVCRKHSFEHEGADHAQRFLSSHGLPQEKIDVVREAIILHTSEIAEEKQPEIALVHFGAGMDILGLRVGDISEEMMRSVLESYPRLGFKQTIIELIKHDADLKSKHQLPHNLSSALLQMGLVHGVLNSPFTE